jgi:hypothetical protein
MEPARGRAIASRNLEESKLANAARGILAVPMISSWIPTDNPLSISRIQTSVGAPCVLSGVDGAVVTLPEDGGSVDVEPPQTIVGGE